MGKKRFALFVDIQTHLIYVEVILHAMRKAMLNSLQSFFHILHNEYNALHFNLNAHTKII